MLLCLSLGILSTSVYDNSVCDIANDKLKEAPIKLKVFKVPVLNGLPNVNEWYE